VPKKPNFSFERRQKDLAKKKKRQEKLEAKRARKAAGAQAEIEIVEVEGFDEPPQEK
jgi:hypothetical protein